MPHISSFKIIFLIYNFAVGLLVGTLAAGSPVFATLGVPTFLWLVAGLFAFEMLAGLAMKTHPSTLITMPWRIAGLMVSFAACYLTLGALTAA
jgi:hypothetical protein